MMPEAEFRKKIQDTVNRVEKSFENIDPDVAECEQTFGALTVTFADKSRCILSAQPSVRQLWLAVAARGVAFHFDWNEASSSWMDDKGRGIELFDYLKKYFKEATQIDFTF